MIQVYIGDDGYARLGHIRGVQSASHSDFQHGKVHPFSRKMQKGGCRKKLKEAWSLGKVLLMKEPFHCFANIRKGPGKGFIRNFLPPNLNSLIHSHQMRGSVKPDADARAMENRGQHRAG